MSPKVTLAMPVYNGDRHIRDAIDSILNQSYTDIELIITDNQSTDATKDICESYSRIDNRVRYFQNPTNLGAARNYNRGFELARGDYLKWCAHDDRLSPTHIERCVEVLEQRPDVALAFARTECIDENGNEIAWPDDSFMSAIEADDASERFSDAIWSAGTCFPIFGLFRRQALEASTLHRGYYGSDRALIAETALLGKIALAADDAVFYNREHRNRSINIADHAERSRWQNASASRRASMEHVNLLLHLIEIAWRHPNQASRFRSLVPVAQLAINPRQMGRYALDIMRFVSPTGTAGLKRWVTGWAQRTG